MTEVFPDDEHYLGLALVVTCVIQLSCFAVAFKCKFDLITDFAGSTNFVVLGIASLLLGGEYHVRQVVLTSMLAVSRIELALFLLYRVCTRKSDARFDETREDFWKFLFFWVFQIVWVYLVSMPVFWVNSVVDVDPEIQALDYLGWAMWGFGFVAQTVGDLQKLWFRQNSENKLKVCDKGVWALSRHPNYYGEILMWLGIFVSTTPVWATNGNGDGFASVVSPLFTILILLFLSGMPTAEGKALKRYYESGDAVKAEYVAYREKTAPIIMFPPSLYKVLPGCVKQWFCCEWSQYEYRAESQPISKSSV